jgi:hypothetical protein
VTGANQVLPFKIGADGRLTAVPTGGVGAPVTPPLLLGLAQHPTLSIVYAGLTGAKQIGAFTFDAAGNLSLKSTTPVTGAAPCWTLVSADGKFLYSVDTGTDSVGVFSLADPLHPKQIQEFVLGGPHNAAGDPSAPTTTAPFEFALDPSGKSLYVINHSSDASGNFPQGNALHVLSVASDGTLSEPAGSIQFLPSDIPAGADPQGVAVIAAPKDFKFDFHDQHHNDDDGPENNDH